MALKRENELSTDVTNEVSVLSSETSVEEDAGTSSQTQQRDTRDHVNEFAEVRQQIKQRGLMDKQPLYYTLKIGTTLGLLAIGIAVLATVETFWIQLVNAGFLALVFTQIGFLGHDAGHRQIFHSARNNEFLSLVITFLLGLDRSWWIDKHTRHHNNPNHTTLDPDVDFPVIAFTKEQALKKEGFFRLIVKYQAFLFIPLLFLEGLGIRLASVRFLLSGQAKYPVFEWTFMVGHFVVYFALLFVFLSPLQALGFFVLHQALFGLFMGSVFAPNHKGMLMLGDDDHLDFLRRQVLTARNVKGTPFNDFWYGGLNYQIEHHLFPSMSRNKLKEAQVVVRAVCEKYDIPYYETGVFQSNKEILMHLHEESAPLRDGTFKP